MARPAQDERGFTFVRCSGSDGKERVFPNGGRYIYRENSDLPGFLLVDHGLVAVGKDAINAEHTAELIEETAQVAILKVTVSKLGL